MLVDSILYANPTNAIHRKLQLTHLLIFSILYNRNTDPAIKHGKYLERYGITKISLILSGAYFVIASKAISTIIAPPISDHVVRYMPQNIINIRNRASKNQYPCLPELIKISIQLSL